MYTQWLAINFNHYINTNPFAPDYQDDIDIIINDYEYNPEPTPEPPLYIPYEYTPIEYQDEEEEAYIMNDWVLD